MSTTALKSFWTIAICLIASTSFTEVAFANPIAVPGPIAGVGLPVVAIGWGGYWLLRKLRHRTRL
jgi:hypothetical protein